MLCRVWLVYQIRALYKIICNTSNQSPETFVYIKYKDVMTTVLSNVLRINPEAFGYTLAMYMCEFP